MTFLLNRLARLFVTQVIEQLAQELVRNGRIVCNNVINLKKKRQTCIIDPEEREGELNFNIGGNVPK